MKLKIDKRRSRVYPFGVYEKGFIFWHQINYFTTLYDAKSFIKNYLKECESLKKEQSPLPLYIEQEV